MPKYGIPFTELVDMVIEDLREKSASANTRPTIKRRINRVYQYEIPSRFEFDFLERPGTITTVAAYSTGTVATTVGSSTITGTSTVWTSAMTGRKIRFDGADGLYTFTFVSATSGTISPAFAHTADLSGASYEIFQDTYELSEDFSQMSVEPGFYYEIGTGKQQIRYAGDTTWRRRSSTQSSDLANYWREAKTLSDNGFRQVQLSPPPLYVRLIHYEYEAAPAEMREYRSAKATIQSGALTTVILDADLSSLLSKGQLFRVDPKADGSEDGTWVRISSISNNVLTLAESYPITASSRACTISDMPKILPPEAHKALYHGGCWETAKDHKDQQSAVYARENETAMDQLISKHARKRFGLHMANWG